MFLYFSYPNQTRWRDKARIWVQPLPEGLSWIASLLWACFFTWKRSFLYPIDCSRRGSQNPSKRFEDIQDNSIKALKQGISLITWAHLLWWWGSGGWEIFLWMSMGPVLQCLGKTKGFLICEEDKIQTGLHVVSSNRQPNFMLGH